MEKLFADFSLGLFVFQTLIFIGLVLLLKKYAWKPILDAVNEREEGIKNSLESAEEAKKEMASIVADNEKILKEARIERDNLLKDARVMKEKMISDAKYEASIEAEKLISLAKTSIENETMKAMTELKNQIADLSIDIAEKVLRNELSDKKAQMTLVEKLVEEAEGNFSTKQ
jgi:F-type H+-transporting ATPase subunit b